VNGVVSDGQLAQIGQAAEMPKLGFFPQIHLVQMQAAEPRDCGERFQASDRIAVQIKNLSGNKTNGIIMQGEGDGKNSKIMDAVG
jgi:hypothetical protein